jgi:hypothetical protein
MTYGTTTVPSAGITNWMLALSLYLPRYALKS